MPSTSVSAEIKTSLVLEDSNVAVSIDPLGTTSPVQLVNPEGLKTKFQSPLKSPSQVQLAAKLDSVVTIKISASRSPVVVPRMHRSSLAVPFVILPAFVFIDSALVDD